MYDRLSSTCQGKFGYRIILRFKCPVADLPGNVKYSGVYQTVTTLGAITVSVSYSIFQ